MKNSSIQTIGNTDKEESSFSANYYESSLNARVFAESRFLEFTFEKLKHLVILVELPENGPSLCKLSGLTCLVLFFSME